jgi:hypothetical protein
MGLLLYACTTSLLITDDKSQVPSSINRISTLIDPQYLSFGLNYADALVIPLQGFWNSVIYIIISRREFNALFRKLREASR